MALGMHSRVAIALLGAGLVACAPLGRSPSPFTGFYKDYASCRQEYAEMDARVARAGVGSAEFYRVPGHPYLRTDRLLASFRNDVQGLEDVSEWLGRMRELDQDARDYEYINLGMTELQAAIQRDRFLNCGRVLATVELRDPSAWEKLVAVVYPEDDYSDWARWLGLHALRVRTLRAQELAANQELQQQHREAVARSNESPTRLWMARPAEESTPLPLIADTVQLNVLGYPNLLVSQWRTLVDTHAPALWVESAADVDQPAAPTWTVQGLSADPSSPQLSYQVGYTRYRDETLVQITYTIWFKSGERATHVPIDGMIWRVTLDRRLEPLLYESLHPSGDDHRWYVVHPMRLRAEADPELSFIAPDLAPAATPVLHFEAGTHRLRRVVSSERLRPSQTMNFELRAYEELYTMPLPDGGSRSLFDPNGMIAGSEARGEAPGWSSGIPHPGALRQAGHHAVTHIGRRHFDDPDLLDVTFATSSVSVVGVSP